MKNKIISFLETNACPENLKGMKRFSINTENSYGIRIPQLRKFASTLPRDNALASLLWEMASRESRILAGLVADAASFPEEMMESWLVDFNDWELCDQTCFNLFYKIPCAYDKCFEWSKKGKEFEKRAAFSLMAKLALKSSKFEDSKYLNLFPVISEAANDPAIYVRKAVNWALRQIGKRNHNLHKQAIILARELAASGNKTARWIAADALKELESDKVRNSLAKKDRKIAG